MSKILLTGSTGNLGTAIVRAAEKLSVVALDRNNWSQMARLAIGCDTIVHAASDIKTAIALDPGKIIEADLATTTRLLALAPIAKIKRFIFISSCAVYGSEMKTREDGPHGPESINGLIKSLNERMIAAFCARHAIQYQFLRVFNMYGGKDQFSILYHLQESLRTGVPFRLKNKGLSQRDFIHVDDVARILMAVISADFQPQAINVGTGVATKIADIVALVAQRYPRLQIEHVEAPEVEYSRADTGRLTKLYTNFIDVKDFIRNDFKVK